jgi:type I restriction enzyme S subunit
MNKTWRYVPLHELLSKSEERITLNPEETYREITIKLWGRGVILRREVVGAEIAAGIRFIARKQQFILSRIDARNGAFGLVPDSLDGAVVTNDFPVFNLNTERLLPHYMELFSKTADFVDLCKAASEGTTNRIRLKEERFLAATIPLPALEEQRRIVARIEELAAKIEEARGLRRESEESIKALLLSAYSDVIKGAPYLPMSEVAPLVRRPVQVNIAETYRELGIRSFGKGTFHKPAISGAELGNKRIFAIEPNDLLFNIVFAWEGAVAIAQPHDAGRVGSHRFLTCVAKEGVATPAFLCFHFLTKQGLEQLGEASPGGVDRNRTLGLQSLANIRVPIPTFDKQLWFDSIHSKFDSIKRLQEETATELDALLPSILDKAFKGEL